MLKESNSLRPDIELSSNSNFRIIVSVIGYQSQGESIVIRCYDMAQESSLYCLVIDSYQFQDRNITKELLEKDYKIKHIDFLCWTHPHVDHSKGLEDLIKTFCDKRTSYILPEYLYNLQSDLCTSLTQEEQACVEAIFAQNAKTKLSALNTSVAPQGCNLIKTVRFSAIGDSPVVMKIYALTPINSILANYHRQNRHDVNPNELSVSLLIDIDGYKLFFGADAINAHIDAMKIIGDCRFVKIPHHGSDTSSHLINHLSNLDMACTSVYHISKDLPLPEIVEKYKHEKKACVYCTGSYKKCKEEYGVITYTINIHDIPDESIQYSIETTNSAQQL